MWGFESCLHVGLSMSMAGRQIGNRPDRISVKDGTGEAVG